jgi:alkylhydroperoxidase family enzyme
VARLQPVQGTPTDGPAAAVYGHIIGKGHEVPAVLQALAHSPELLRAWTDLTWPLRDKCQTPRAIRELAIMRVAQLADAAYAWEHHRPWALSSGIRPAQLDALKAWPSSAEFDEDERAVLAAADEITAGRLSDAAYDRLAARFDEQGIVELVVTISFYGCAARVIDALGVELEPAYRASRAPA